MNAVADWRATLASGTRDIHQRFVDGATAGEALALRSNLVDRVIKSLWNGQGGRFDKLTLLAVGGYGRGELHPSSDVDIAILTPPTLEPALESALSAWITSLWDLGLEFGCSVRNVADSEREAAADITVITNLMEARYLAGDVSLYQSMQAVIAPDRMWPPERFIEAKLAEQDARRARFHTNAYRLEPNIKESVGGLRDFQTIAWVVHRQFGTSDLNPLVSHELLEPKELTSLNDGLELLWRIRYWLHHLSGRHEDRLLFDYQKDIAHAFGFCSEVNNEDIEALMQCFYRAVMGLQRLNEILLQGLSGIISDVTAGTEVVPINSRFQLRNGLLEVTDELVFLHYPPALLELFIVYGNTPAATNVSANTVRLVRANLKLINDRFRSDPAVRKLFLDIFANPNKLTRTIRMMNRYGVMAAYLPAFDAIVGRMQYDLFHIFTVDEHTIHVIRNLRRFSLPAYAAEFPHCSEVASRVARPQVLYLTALFHDIAKGRGGDHSVLGAEDAMVFAEQHRLPYKDAKLMEWTVRHHLDMSITTQRKDIDDPAVQLDFAQLVGTIERLDYLYLLTVADIRATNPDLWNSFKQSLLHSLYQHTLVILQRGLDNPLDAEGVIARRQAHTRTLLPESLLQDQRLEVLWTSLGVDYFRQYQAAEIARHTEILMANEESAGTLVNVRHSPSRGSHEILIYTPDDEALFALITTVLETQQLTVLSATINTTDAGFALDTFHVLQSDGCLIDSRERMDEIRHQLIRELGEPKNIPALSAPRRSRRLEHFSVLTNVEFDDDESLGLTTMRVTAADRPGILSTVGRVLMQAGMSMHSALISTLGERIDDVFVVANRDARPLSDSEREQLAALLVEQL